MGVLVHWTTQLFSEGLLHYCGITHTCKDMHLKANDAVLDCAFDVLVRGGALTENPVVTAQIFQNGKAREKRWVFNREAVAKALDKEVKEAWATGEYDEYLHTSVKEAWEEAIEESPDLQKVFETLAL